jgi:hypothetical protein
MCRCSRTEKEQNRDRGRDSLASKPVQDFGVVMYVYATMDGTIMSDFISCGNYWVSNISMGRPCSSILPISDFECFSVHVSSPAMQLLGLYERSNVLECRK